MKKLKTSAFILFILTSILSHADSTSDIPVGKIEFISRQRCEVIIYASDDSGLAAASTGSVLYTMKGKNRVTLTVSGTGGRFIRCTFKCGKTDTLTFSEGNEVYFSESDNSAKGYSDVKVLMHRLMKAYRDFILAVESSEDPDVIAAEINRLADSLELLMPEIKRLNARYPELKNFTASPPEELKADIALLNRTGLLVSDAFLKAAKLQPHKSIDEALMRIKAVMETMEKSGR